LLAPIDTSLNKYYNSAMKRLCITINLLVCILLTGCSLTVNLVPEDTNTPVPSKTVTLTYTPTPTVVVTTNIPTPVKTTTVTPTPIPNSEGSLKYYFVYRTDTPFKTIVDILNNSHIGCVAEKRDWLAAVLKKYTAKDILIIHMDRPDFPGIIERGVVRIALADSQMLLSIKPQLESGSLKATLIED